MSIPDDATALARGLKNAKRKKRRATEVETPSKRPRKAEILPQTSDVQEIKVKKEPESEPAPPAAADQPDLQIAPCSPDPDFHVTEHGKENSDSNAQQEEEAEPTATNGTCPYNFEAFFGMEMIRVWDMYACTDHDYGDMLFGASTVVFAEDESSARQFLNKHLVNHGLKPYAEKHFSLIRVPFNAKAAHLVCVSYQSELTTFSNNAQKRLTRYSDIADSDSGHIFAHNHDKHRLFYATNIVETIPMRCGAIVVASSAEEALKLLERKIKDATGIHPGDPIPYRLREVRASDVGCMQLPVIDLVQ